MSHHPAEPAVAPAGRGGAWLSASFESRSLGDTGTLARVVAGLLRPGDVVLLVGDLGAGKTAFTKLLSAAMGVTTAVTSPTFTIMSEHDARLSDGAPVTLLHLDAYRLDGPDAMEDIGVFELLDDGGVAVIEWGDLVAAAFADAALRVELRWVDEDARAVTVRAAPDGPWADRWSAVIAELGGSPW